MKQIKSPRLDYSALVEAVLRGNRKEASRLSGEILPRLVDYLQVVMGADFQAASECAQQAFMNVYEQIVQNRIKKPAYIFKYLICACRNEYLKFVKIENRYLNSEETILYMKEPAEQLENLIEEERMDLLNDCLDELDNDSKKFILYFLRNPDTSTNEVCDKFDMSNANVRTKKSRLIKHLHHAYKAKSKQTMLV